MPGDLVFLQPLHKRVKNFSEVVLGFSKKQATEEAMRCPQPTNPEHAKRCPLEVDILGFIRSIREGNPAAALQKIRERNPLAGICGRVCSAPCETESSDSENWSIGIRMLERYAADSGEKKISKKISHAKEQAVAVVGSGPSGLTIAGDLAQMGYSVTIFEALHLTGGVLRYGIPEFRLPRKILDNEIEYIQSLGVTIKTNCFVGQTYTVKELFEMGFGAVYLATGSGSPKFLGIPGENLKRVFTVTEFLMRVNLMGSHLQGQPAAALDIGKKIAVIGGGADAVDAARISIRLGKEVTLVFEGTEEDMTKQRQEITYAKEERVRFELLTKTLQIIPDVNNFAKGLKCIKMDFADPDSSGKWQLIPVGGSEFTVDADTVVIAAGYKSNPVMSKFIENLKTNKDGSIKINPENLMTSIPGVFACSDVLTGAQSMVQAMASAKKAAKAIDIFLSQKTQR